MKSIGIRLSAACAWPQIIMIAVAQVRRARVDIVIGIPSMIRSARKAFAHLADSVQLGVDVVHLDAGLCSLLGARSFQEGQKFCLPSIDSFPAFLFILEAIVVAVHTRKRDVIYSRFNYEEEFREAIDAWDAKLLALLETSGAQKAA